MIFRHKPTPEASAAPSVCRTEYIADIPWAPNGDSALAPCRFRSICRSPAAASSSWSWFSSAPSSSRPNWSSWWWPVPLWSPLPLAAWRLAWSRRAQSQQVRSWRPAALWRMALVWFPLRYSASSDSAPRLPSAPDTCTLPRPQLFEKILAFLKLQYQLLAATDVAYSRRCAPASA